MDVISASYQVSSWKDIAELRSVFHLVFDENSTVEDKSKAYRILQSWKVRRSQETLTGIFCTLSLLNVHLIDVTGKISDPFTLSTLYASSLTKFLNFATSFQLRDATMYRSAYRLGIDSFLIDLRHLCSHGKQLPSLEVFRRSHSNCLDWIKKYFWENELQNVSDASSKNIRYDETLGEKLREILPFYDTLAELIHSDLGSFRDLAAYEITKQRWPEMEKFMEQKKFWTFRQAFNYITQALVQIIQSKQMSQHPRTFFHELFEQCDYFMKASEDSDSFVHEGLAKDDDRSDTEGEVSPPKRRRKAEPTSIVNLYQQLIWQIAKHDYLKLFLDTLYQISMNESETYKRRQAARFWITIVLGSFRYYQSYCRFSKESPTLQTKITEETRKVYSYQLDADLKKVIIFVGTQLLPSSLKFSKEFFFDLLHKIDKNDEQSCTNLLPFVYPPLTDEQRNDIKDLIKIDSKGTRKFNDSLYTIYTIDDLFPSKLETREEKPKDEDTSSSIWKLSSDDIDWSSQPIGKDFSIV